MGNLLNRLGWIGGLAWVVVGCAGNASSESASATAGSSGAPAHAAESDALAQAAGSSGAPALGFEGGAAGAHPGGAEAGAEEQAQCTGKLKNVANAFDFACPREFCEARLLASDCAALPSNVTKTVAEQCGDYADDLSLSFQISPTQLKVCYYGSEPYDAGAMLIGAEVWDEAAEFCDGTTHRIQGGHVRKTCSQDRIWAPAVTLCDLARADQSAPDEDVPPRACFNKFSRSCQPCCAATAPDCRDKPDGYPGYECTPVAPPDPDDRSEEKNPWCSCRCNDAEWACSC